MEQTSAVAAQDRRPGPLAPPVPPAPSAPTGKPASAGASPGVWTVSAVVVVGAFMTQLDSALVNIGLRTVASDLHSSLQTTQWIVSAYLLALVMGLPLCSWTARRFGAGRLWLWALACFTVFSAVCAAAPNVQVLILARVAQGFAGGMLLPAGQTIIAQVAGRQLMGRVMSVVGTALVLAPALGPIVGGLTLEHVSWPWLFLINVPVGIVGLAWGRRVIPRGTSQATSGFDTFGFVLVGGALPLMTYAISQSAHYSRLSVTAFYGPLLVGAAALGVFGWRSRRPGRPALLKMSLFADQRFLAASVCSFLVGVIAIGVLVVWPLYLQIVRNYGVVTSGLAMVGFAVGSAALPLSGRLTDKVGGGRVCLVGTLLMAAASIPVVLAGGHTSLVILEASLVVLGLGNAFSVVPAFTAAFVAVAPADIPDAVTIVNILLRLGGAVGASLFVAIIGNPSSRLSKNVGHFHAAFTAVAVIGILSFASALALTFSKSTLATGGQPATRGRES